MPPFTPLLVTSQYEVFIEGMEYNATFHTSTCDLTVWSIYWGDGVCCHLSHLYLWPHSMKYLLRGWSIMPPFTPLLVTSQYEVFIEGMEYDATFHTSTCDLTVWSIYWGDGVWCHLSHLYLWPHSMKYLLRGWSIMPPFTPLLVTSQYEVFIEGMEYNATFHTSTCDLTVWSIYWGDGV